MPGSSRTSTEGHGRLDAPPPHSQDRPRLFPSQETDPTHPLPGPVYKCRQQNKCWPNNSAPRNVIFPGLTEGGHVSSGFCYETSDPQDPLNPTAAASQAKPRLPTWMSRAAGHRQAVSLLQIKGPNLNLYLR